MTDVTDSTPIKQALSHVRKAHLELIYTDIHGLNAADKFVTETLTEFLRTAQRYFEWREAEQSETQGVLNLDL
jgi:hypothetical protein